MPIGENVVVIGASSGIAKSLCVELAKRGCGLVLAGRNVDELRALADEINGGYHVAAAVERFEAEQIDDYHDFWRRATAHFSDGASGLIVCHGFLPKQQEAERNTSLVRKSIEINFLSAAVVMEIAAAYFVERKCGYIAAISSVAGDRGRQSNYIYGAAKAGLSAYLQGLRNRLHHQGVHVLTIKPGFVATRMISCRISPESWMVASPEHVARQIDRAIRRRRNVLYTPRVWRVIMAVVRAIPETIFKRMRL